MSKQNESRFTLTVSPEVEAVLEKAAEEAGVSKAEVIRRGIFLYDYAVNETKKGWHLGLTKQKDKLERELIQLY
jgi:hypothetical protein